MGLWKWITFFFGYALYFISNTSCYYEVWRWFQIQNHYWSIPLTQEEKETADVFLTSLLYLPHGDIYLNAWPTKVPYCLIG